MAISIKDVRNRVQIVEANMATGPASRRKWPLKPIMQQTDLGLDESTARLRRDMFLDVL